MYIVSLSLYFVFISPSPVGEPLANYRNVKIAIQRIHDELGIGHRRITVSTVGVVPNIIKLANDFPHVRLAVSLHCASDEERSALIPANKRFGGLNRLMPALQEHITTTGRRITLEWALIAGQNDNADTAHALGRLIRKYMKRPDMVHINVIPLNPTGGYGGGPSGRDRVNAFCHIMESVYKVRCTPRVRRGIDIQAGCGQLKATIERKKNKQRTLKTLDEVMEEAIAMQNIGNSQDSDWDTNSIDTFQEGPEGDDEDDLNDYDDDENDEYDDPTSIPTTLVDEVSKNNGKKRDSVD